MDYFTYYVPKALGDCTPGEIVSVSVDQAVEVAISVAHPPSHLALLAVIKPGEGSNPRFLSLPKEQSCLSYGADWRIEVPFDPLQRPFGGTANNFGAIVDSNGSAHLHLDEESPGAGSWLNVASMRRETPSWGEHIAVALRWALRFTGPGTNSPPTISVVAQGG